MRISELQQKDVVSVTDGKRLGPITDIEVNLESGTIEAIIVQSGSQWKGWFSKSGEVIFHWKDVVKIGDDVILVRGGVHEPESLTI